MPTRGPRTLAHRVRQARELAGLTQAGLAEAAGVTDETVSRLERGAFEPSLSTIVALADALGLSLDALVGPAARRAAAREAGPARPPSPLLQRLAARFEQLDPEAQRLLVRLADLLPPAGGYRGPEET